ncbi:MAG TPA: hypothetical protein VNG29_01895 [Candidatus Paceibacterota bacterium]|nr:hypothetical protein [Candidatus Paceibacterota bacterium]
MTLKDRLAKLLEAAGVSAEDRNMWSRSIDAFPFDRAEVFVYVLERLGKEDTAFFNENLKEKFAFAWTMEPKRLMDILGKEKAYVA